MTENVSHDHQRAAAYFDRKAELFDSLYSLDKATPFMRFMNRHFRNDIYERYLLTVNHVKAVKAQSVLDVGIGSGRYATGYAEAGVKRVVGVDISSSMLDYGARACADSSTARRPSSSLFCRILMLINTADKFDVVVAMGFFDYISEPVPSLKKLREFCTHSVIASFPSISFYRTPLRKVRYAIKKCPVYFYRVEQIERLAHEAGFSKCQVTKIKGAGMDYVAIMTR